MIKRVIFKIGSINETLFVNQVHLYLQPPCLNLRRQKQSGGHCSAEALLLGGKFINFAYVSLITSACLNNAGIANKRCYGILQNKRNRNSSLLIHRVSSETDGVIRLSIWRM